MKLKYKILYEDKSKDVVGCELPDGTIVLVDEKFRGIRIAYPKKKFFWIIVRQLFQRRKYVEFLFSQDRLRTCFIQVKFFYFILAVWCNTVAYGPHEAKV